VTKERNGWGKQAEKRVKIYETELKDSRKI
jgi:hypothetical protein